MLDHPREGEHDQRQHHRQHQGIGRGGAEEGREAEAEAVDHGLEDEKYRACPRIGTHKAATINLQLPVCTALGSIRP